MHVEDHIFDDHVHMYVLFGGKDPTTTHPPKQILNKSLFVTWIDILYYRPFFPFNTPKSETFFYYFDIFLWKRKIHEGWE